MCAGGRPFLRAAAGRTCGRLAAREPLGASPKRARSRTPLNRARKCSLAARARAPTGDKRNSWPGGADWTRPAGHLGARAGQVPRAWRRPSISAQESRPDVCRAGRAAPPGNERRFLALAPALGICASRFCLALGTSVSAAAGVQWGRLSARLPVSAGASGSAGARRMGQIWAPKWRRMASNSFRPTYRVQFARSF